MPRRAREPEPLSEDVAAGLRHLIGEMKWTWAKTYAEKAPHWYTRKRDDPERYAALFDAVQAYGIRGKFGKYYYRYLRPGDGMEYWTMTTSLDYSQVLNRAEIKSAADGNVPPADGL